MKKNPWRQAGYRSRSERDRIERDARARVTINENWSFARKIASSLTEGETPPPLTVWGLVLQEDEEAHFDLSAMYARYFGYSGSYTHVDGLFIGSGTFMAVGIAATALGNKARRDAAAANAVQRWREFQNSRILLTNKRLICAVNGRWLSFYYSGLTAFYPEPRSWSLVMDFPETTPLLLTGYAVPTICAYVAWAVHGPQGLANHPAMAPLFGSPAPTPTPAGLASDPYQRST